MVSADKEPVIVEKQEAQGRLSLQAIVAIGILLLLATVVIGAFVTGRGAEGSMDGFTKVQFKIFAESRDRVVKEGSSRPTRSPAMPAKLAERINESARQLIGAYVLWVDDGGALQNSWERRALGSLGVAIDTASSSDEAMTLLESGLAYDVIITDLSRPADTQAPCYPGDTPYASAGCRLIQQARALCGEEVPPIIVYSANLNVDAGEPAHVLGMTNRFDQLLEYVLDGLERRPAASTMPSVAGPCMRTPLAAYRSGESAPS